MDSDLLVIVVIFLKEASHHLFEVQDGGDRGDLVTLGEDFDVGTVMQYINL